MTERSGFLFVVFFLFLTTGADSVENLMLKTNQTADSICLGDDYYLFCVSQEPFGNMCSVTTPSWYNNRTGRIDTTSNTKYNESTANATVAVLKFRITEEFNEPQTFYCAAATTCMSNEVLVRRYDEPLSPVIGNVTVGTTWINLTWYHNKTCCTNSTYMLLWQQWQSEGASANMSMVDPADPHLSITQLKPGTMYMVNVSVECQGHELKNATECITTKYTDPPTIAEATNDTVNTHLMLIAGQKLTLNCTAIGTPRPQIDWYKRNMSITNSSRIQINETKICDSRLVSTLIISSVTVGDSGPYDCRVQNSVGSYSFKYQVLVTADTDGAIAGGVVVGLVAILIVSAGVVIANLV